MSSGPTDTPPGPMGWPVVGNSLQFFRDPLGYPDQWHREYGDLVGLRIAGRDGLLVGHPDYVQQVLADHFERYRKGELYLDELSFLRGGLLTSEGETWRRQRQHLGPMFQPDAVEPFREAMIETAERSVAEIPTDSPIPIEQSMQGLTLEVIAKTMLGVDLRDRTTSLQEALEAVMAQARASSRLPISAPEWLPTPGNRRYRSALDRFDELIDDIIEEHRTADDPPADVVTGLLKRQRLGGGSISDREIRDQILTFLLAGHDTTALALSYTCELLARHPEVQEQLRAQVASGEAGPRSEPTELLEGTIKEGLRLYPPSYLFLREAIEADAFGDVAVEPGTTIVLHPWLIHRDDRFYDEPEAFRPDRWTESFEANLHPFAYFPFSGGPRRCIGGHFAMLELEVVLPILLERLRFEATSQEPPALKPRITLRPKAGIEVLPTPVS